MKTDLSYSKPRILISRCFLKPVRYNGEMIKDDFVEKIKDYVDFVDICPEKDIGLGVPRKRVILVKQGNVKRLVQPETGKDLTDKMQNYLDKTLCRIKDVDGFLLKARSPSCGVSDTKLHDRNGNVSKKTDGIFAESVRNKFPHLPLEDEERLRDYEIRHHFLTRIFAFSDLRHLRNDSISDLIDFHLKYKYLLMTYNQRLLRELGRLVADSNIEINKKVKTYKSLFYEAFNKKPSIAKHYNTLLHIMGYLTEKISKRQRQHLLELIERYKKGLVDLRIIIEIFKSMVSRFEVDYLLRQRYIMPFPESLY